MASSTLAAVHALLVVSGTAVGVAAGVLLDPLGQRLADRSRSAEERRRAERAERRRAAAATVESSTDDVPVAPAGPAAVPDLDAAPTAPAVTDQPAAEGIPAEPVRHLLSEGPSVPRMVGAGVVTGLLFGLTAANLTVRGHPADLVLVLPFWVFLAAAVTLSVTDLTHRLVPRQMVYAAGVVIAALLVVSSAHLHQWHPLVDAAIAGVGAFAVLFVVWFFVPRGMGFGDVRLAGLIGLTVGYLGLLQAYLSFLTGFVLGLLFGLLLMIGSPSGRKTQIPFAPALCIGAAIAIVWGDPLVHHLFHASN
jgi:leader peptidase (prepilin peptidase) / N-methyltransferase